MTTKKKPSSKRSVTRRVAKKVSQKTGVDPKVVREAINKEILARNAGKSLGYLSFAGILPVDLPDGTRIAVLPDIHVPAHDKLLLWAVKKFLKDFQPHILIFIGDVADVFALSRWGRPPRVSADMQYELDETRRLVDELMKISGCVHTFYIMGNHEDRIMRYLKDPATGVANILDPNTREPIMSFHGLMGYGKGDPVTFLYDLDERSGYGGAIVVNEDMEFHHGFIVRPKPGASPLADADRTGRSVSHGHTHRAGMVSRDMGHKTLRAYEFGHLTDPTHPYMGYANLLNNWRQAIGAGEIVGGKVHLQPLAVKPVKSTGGKLVNALVFNGQIYRASDR